MSQMGAQSTIGQKNNSPVGGTGASLTDDYKKDLQKKVESIYNVAMQKVRKLENEKQKIVKQYIRELEQNAIQNVREQLKNLPDKQFK